MTWTWIGLALLAALVIVIVWLMRRPEEPSAEERRRTAEDRLRDRELRAVRRIERKREVGETPTARRARRRGETEPW